MAIYRSRLSSIIGMLAAAANVMATAAFSTYEVGRAVVIGMAYVARSWAEDFLGNALRLMSTDVSPHLKADPGMRLQKMDAHASTMLKRQVPRKEAAWSMCPSA